MLDQHLVAKTRPQATKENVVLWKNYRITVLQDRLFRLEYNTNKHFRDEATQTVWFRDMPAQDFCVKKTENGLTIATSSCKLLLKKERKDCRIELDGKICKIDNAGNLRGTSRTLDGYDGDTFVGASNDRKKDRPKSAQLQLGVGVCSISGIAVFDDVNSLTLNQDGKISSVHGEGSDEYIFVYGKDYRGAVKALYLITGNVPLIPRFALGNWWSRYREYTQEEYMRVVARFEEEKIPLTVATIDMDWHYSEYVDEQKGITKDGKNTPFFVGEAGGKLGWTGYSWNVDLFPDYKQMLKEIKAHGLKITLNLHPAGGVRWWENQYNEMATAMGIDPNTCQCVDFDISNEVFINKYFQVLHKPYENDGVDFWWIDWQQGTKTKIEGLDPLWSLNHYHYLDNAKNHETPLILSRYSGIGAHRYPLGFSGDTIITWETLDYLPQFTATASNIGYTWWSHDIGGHFRGEKSNELFVRHIQYGVFSPINRLHCSSWDTLSKEPWLYGNGAGKIIAEWMRFRHSLIPYLYSAAYRTYAEGIALVEPLYYEWNTRQAYNYPNEYLFGGQLLVAPITTKRRKDGFSRVKVWIPEGIWTDIFTGDRYVSPMGGRSQVLYRELDSIPVLIRDGGILPLSIDEGNSVENPEKIEINLWEGTGQFSLFENGKGSEDVLEAFTDFKSAYQEINGEGRQTISVSTHGDISVIPKNRVLKIVFKDMPNGIIRAYKNGKEFELEKVYASKPTAIFQFDSTAKYEVVVNYPVQTEIERIKNRALEVLLRAEDENVSKFSLWEKIKKTQSMDEYQKVIEEVDVREIIKLRLKETL